MDIRAAYDWSRVIDWMDSDVTTATIKNAIAFVVVWWLAQGWFRAAAREQVLVEGQSTTAAGGASARAIASIIAPGCAMAKRMAAVDSAVRGVWADCPCATANMNTVSPFGDCVNKSA